MKANYIQTMYFKLEDQIMLYLGILIGFIAGMFFGIFTMCLLQISKEDKQMSFNEILLDLYEYLESRCKE